MERTLGGSFGGAGRPAVEAGKGPPGAARNFQGPHYALVILQVEALVGYRVALG